MKTISLNLVFLLTVYILSAVESEIVKIGIESEGLWEAQDYEGAKAMLQPLTPLSLPEWQKSRLLYNLGSIDLALHQTSDSLKLLRQINPSDLSFPRFARNFFINLGIAQLQYAQHIDLNHSSNRFEEQLLWIKQSLRAFQQAQEIDCKLQHDEEKEEGCSPQQLIDEWTKAAESELDKIYRKRSENWLQQASKEDLSSLLAILLEELVLISEKFNKKVDVPDFQSQIRSLEGLWHALQQKILPQEVKVFDESYQTFQNLSQAKDFSVLVEDLKRSLLGVELLGYKDNIDFHLAHLNYEILLLDHNPTSADIQGVQWEIKQIKGNESENRQLEKIKIFLQEAHDSLEKHQGAESRLSLLAGFGLFDSLIHDTENALSILRQALDQAKRCLDILLLSRLVLKDSPFDKGWVAVLKMEQEAVLKDAQNFIPTVLKEQSVKFHQTDPAIPARKSDLEPQNGAEDHSPGRGRPGRGNAALGKKDLAGIADADLSNSCQQSPWDQTIPLFDRGYGAAQEAMKVLNEADPNILTVAPYFEEVIRDWEQALALLTNPPKPPQGAQTQAAPRNLAETFRLVQEMIVEDQPQRQPQEKEYHSW